MARLVSEHFKSNGQPKRAFGTKEAAEKERARSKKGASYRCSFCNEWHVGGRAKTKTTGKRSVTE